MWYEDEDSDASEYAEGSEETDFSSSALAEFIQTLDDTLMDLLNWSSKNWLESSNDNDDFIEDENEQKARRIATNVAPLSKVSRKYFEKVQISLESIRNGLENRERTTIHTSVISIREHVLEAKDLLHFKFGRVKYKLQRAQTKLESNIEPDQGNSKTMARVKSFEVEAPHLIRERTARDIERIRKIEEVIKDKGSRLWKFVVGGGMGALSVGVILFFYFKGIPFLLSMFAYIKRNSFTVWRGVKNTIRYTYMFSKWGGIIQWIGGILCAMGLLLVIIRKSYHKWIKKNNSNNSNGNNKDLALSSKLLAIKEEELNPVDVFYEITVQAMDNIANASAHFCAICKEDGLVKTIQFISWETPFLKSNTEVCLRHCTSLVSSYKNFCKSVKYQKTQSKLVKKYSGPDMHELELDILDAMRGGGGGGGGGGESLIYVNGLSTGSYYGVNNDTNITTPSENTSSTIYNEHSFEPSTALDIYDEDFDSIVNMSDFDRYEQEFGNQSDNLEILIDDEYPSDEEVFT